MKIKDLTQESEQEVAGLMRRVPFYNELLSDDPKQLGVLMKYSCLVELAPGETIMRRGDKGSWLYFLVKGRLAVYLDEASSGEPLNHITPGELFGDLALLCEHERKATVVADPAAKSVLVFATDFKPFGDLTDFSRVSLKSKLLFYRIMVHSIRWRIEVNKMNQPDSPLVSELRQVPSFQGVKGSNEELLALHQQARYLAELLNRWNNAGVGLEDIIVVEGQ